MCHTNYVLHVLTTYENHLLWFSCAVFERISFKQLNSLCHSVTMTDEATWCMILFSNTYVKTFVNRFAMLVFCYIMLFYYRRQCFLWACTIRNMPVLLLFNNQVVNNVCSLLNKYRHLVLYSETVTLWRKIVTDSSCVQHKCFFVM